VVEETIKKLDILPKQVLIEALVAEITLTDNMSFGLEYFLKAGGFAIQPFALGTGVGNIVQGAPIGTPGFSLTFVDGDDFKIFLRSLSNYTRIDTLATPHVLTMNNKEAKIQVGQEVPIVTGTQADSTGSTTDQVFQTVQQRNIGRILAIKPHVNEKREVTLDLNLEVTDALPRTEDQSGVQGQAFSKRAVQTSVVVEDGQSLLIGGIISDSRRQDQGGIPWLSRIPVIKYLFGTHGDRTDRTELFIMLTPRVVGDPREGRTLTDEFRKRLRWMDESLRKSQQSGEPAPW
jgi:general secretion pathway protein D